jgi:tetratricopeptide (TPR) repeat protein
VQRLIVAAITLAVTTIASAQPVVDKPEAERLFDEGRALLASGHSTEACAKFELSLLKDPRAVGTLLNLGLCNERSGKVASALKLFREAYDRANEAGMVPERGAAQEHIATLTPQVPIVVIVYAAPPIADTKLVVDDQVISIEAKLLPLDPGHHGIVLTAPGRLPYQTTIDVAIRTRTELALPVLQLPKQSVVVVSNSRRQIGKVALWSGAALVVGASALAGWARYKYGKLYDDGHCTATKVCDPYGVDVTARSRLDGNVATVVGGLGFAAAVTGVVLLLTAPSDREQQIVPTGNAHALGLVYARTF